MQEVARTSKDVTKDQRGERERNMEKTKPQQTFATASEAAGDHAQGTKRKGGDIVNEVPKKHNQIAFVNSGDGHSQDDKEGGSGAVLKELSKSSDPGPSSSHELKASCSTNASTSKEPTAGCSKDVAMNVNDVAMNVNDVAAEPEKIDYMEELSRVRCAAPNHIANHMFNTKWGRLALLVRSWGTKLCNIQESCRLCNIKYEYQYDIMTNVSSVIIENKLVAQASDATKKLSKKAVENLAWEILINEAITILVKEQFIAQDDFRIDFSEELGQPQPGPREDDFGAPVEASVADRMMRMMGWQGGGLGADCQGIAEPVRPHMQLVNRAGLGSVTANIHQIKNAADSLMKRFRASDCIDVDLIFSHDFTKAERAAIHQVAGKNRLVSRSYGQGAERFLVVKKKIDIFSLALAVVQKGGSTPKYQIFIPAKAARFYKELE